MTFCRFFVQDRRDDDLTDVVYRLNDFASANENPDQWLAVAPQNYEFTEETFTPDTGLETNLER